MRKNFSTLILIVLAVCETGIRAYAQQPELRPVAKTIAESKSSATPFKKTQPLLKANDVAYKATAELFAHDITFAKMDVAEIHQLYSTRNAALELTIPYKNNTTITLDLVQVNIFGDGFAVVTSESNNQPVDYVPGVYYQGTIKDDPNSIAAISIFENEIMGIVSNDGEGNINIGKYGKGNVDDYMIYSDRDIIVPNDNAGCATYDDPSYADELQEMLAGGGDSRISKCPAIYFEADYQLYQNKGSVTNTTNYITGIYNNSAVIYNNEYVPTTVSTIFVWTTSDGYSSASSSAALDDFMNYRTSFTGNIAHLVALDPGGLGGVAATINGLCNPYKYCYSDIESTYSDFPTYSWTVMVVTHEMGHLFGSYHTQNCSWIGGAIDNCYTTEGGCSPGPTPTSGGTIMSYCHLTGYGINFNNGFGVQPGNAIRNTISAAACVATCGAAPTYCLSNGALTGRGYINSVVMGGITNTSGNNAGYGNYTGTTMTLTAGGTASFTLTPGYPATTYSQNFSIFIDYNHDYDFADAGENVYNSAAVTAAVSSSFVVSATATGTTRVRISMKNGGSPTSCENFSYGEVEDYTVTFIGGGVTYCASNGINAASKFIDYVGFGTLTRTSASDGGYYNGTGLSTNVVKGSSYTLTYSAGFSGGITQMYWSAWIDLNIDGNFSGSELCLQRKVTTGSSLTKNFTIPTTASTGLTRMRVSCKYGAYPTACESFAEGEVEDYSVNIMPALPSGEQADYTMHIYPNPSNGLYNLQYTNAFNGGIRMEIFDITGKNIRSEQIEGYNGTVIIDINMVPDGLYYVKTTLADGQTVVKEIVKQ